MKIYFLYCITLFVLLFSSFTEAKENYPPKLTLDDVESYCYIVDWVEEDGKIYVTTDFIIMKEVQKAGGYIIINNNPKLRTFLLDASANITPPEKTIENVKRHVEEYKKNGFEQRFYLKAKEGKITELLIDFAG